MAERQKFDYEQFRQQAVQQLRTGETNLVSLKGLLAPVILDLLETALLPEDQVMGKPVGYVGKITPKVSSLPSEHSDRTGQHSIARTHQAEHTILDFFSRGVTHTGTQRHLAHRGHIIDVATVKQVTDQALPQVRAWRSRPLKPVYSFVWITNDRVRILVAVRSMPLLV